MLEPTGAATLPMPQSFDTEQLKVAKMNLLSSTRYMRCCDLNRRGSAQPGRVPIFRIAHSPADQSKQAETEHHRHDSSRPRFRLRAPFVSQIHEYRPSSVLRREPRSQDPTHPNSWLVPAGVP